MLAKFKAWPKSRIYLVCMIVVGVISIALGRFAYGVGLIVVGFFFSKRIKRGEIAHRIKEAKKPTA